MNEALGIFSHDVTGPGQPRLDSGSPQQAGFPCQMLLRGLLGCHPLVPPLSVFVDLRAALGHVGCCARSMRAVVAIES